ncbi:MAG: hypothetical protein COT92_00280 [Candidatus Doudnabacteria bacterium CG10_big_fil_rev_8_21_14_0_10_42_18]|uniref:DUF2269 domain-containing protein n=1 Tax=Candidatus Doudnabacteria bacterium CG10_big_fil_rev_8_21_14_0_10_42_18 TaxID=1974552 RepID=A0A2H0VBS7_9BACT|nr:MAG: hypothetical protein COT92_00280 [Candidatus Doudnabacteria bacterium CG10_big_fil_rev_8_21_14_0_10_42_18]
MNIPFYINIALFVHIVSFIIGFGAVIVIDSFGLLWLLKKTKFAFVMDVANVTQKLIWLGWVGLVASGSIMLFWKGHIDNLMWIKLFLVLMVGINGVFLHRIKKSFESLSGDEQITNQHKFRIGLASSISQLGWWGALTIGYFHHNISHVINWPNQSFFIIGVVVVFILFAAGAGEYLARQSAP